MPLYDFICESCKEEIKDHICSSEEKILCPKCKTEMTRCMPKIQFFIKGSGYCSYKKKYGNNTGASIGKDTDSGARFPGL